MSNDRDDKLNKDTEAAEFTLEEILAEFGSGPKPSGPDLPWPEAKRRPPPPENVVPFPTPAPEAPGGEDPDGPEEDAEEEEALPPPLRPKTGQPPASDKVLEFPEDDTPPLQAGIEHLKRKADAYAEQMFEQEGVEVSDETLRFERLIPGVDEEEPPAGRFFRERKPRRETAPPPDLPPAELAGRYGRGLGLLRLRAVLVLLLCLPMLWLTLAPLLPFPLPAALAASVPLQGLLSAILLAAAMLLGADGLILGLARLFTLRPGADTLTAFSCLFALADALTMGRLTPERQGLPYCVAAGLSLFFTLWGTYSKRQGLRMACRTAAAASEPYLVTLDEKAWNGRSAYAKWSGSPIGFGSQIQEDDGAQRIFRVAAPLLLLSCLLFSLIASVGRGAPVRLVWCLSATTASAACLSGMLLFGRPFRVLSRRLSSSGAALGGWPGVARQGSAILLTDADLFPPGSVSLNGIKIFGDYPVEKVVAVTATLIRDAGSGLDKIFHDLLRSQGAVYRRTTGGIERHEGGGLTAVIRNEQIAVGSAAFMSLLEVSLPQGLNVRNAVFCAIDGELAGIFALNYVLHPVISPSLTSLIGGKVSPVLATRDFNLIPAMLRQKFKLPVEKMDFPTVERRVELSDPDAPHDPVITAVLCREGLAPFAEAVVGARRLRWAVTAAALLAVLGSVIGVLLAFYLTAQGAWDSLTAANLTFFLTAWLVPTYLISGWVNRYGPQKAAASASQTRRLFAGEAAGHTGGPPPVDLALHQMVRPARGAARTALPPVRVPVVPSARTRLTGAAARQISRYWIPAPLRAMVRVAASKLQPSPSADRSILTTKRPSVWVLMVKYGPGTGSSPARAGAASPAHRASTRNRGANLCFIYTSSSVSAPDGRGTDSPGISAGNKNAVQGIPYTASEDKVSQMHTGHAKYTLFPAL